MTEDEARKKWCPMVRVDLTAGMAVNRPIANITRCIASDCMMWRQFDSTQYPGGGYCGIAGRPSGDD